MTKMFFIILRRIILFISVETVFFSSEKPFVSQFEKKCKQLNYTVVPRGAKQTTYFGFLPPLPADLLKNHANTLGLLYDQNPKKAFMGFGLRFFPSRQEFGCGFGLSPPTSENKLWRDKIFNCRELIWREVKIGNRIKGRGLQHTGIHGMKIPFDTSQINDNESLTVMTDQLFDKNICPFVDSIFTVLEKSLS